MFQTFSPVLNVSVRKTASVHLDMELRFLENNATISKWFRCGSLRGQKISRMFPQLTPYQQALKQLPYRTEGLITLEELQPTPVYAFDPYFSLQVEADPTQGSQLLLTIIDITEQTYLRKHLQRRDTETMPTTDSNKKQIRDLRSLNEAGRILTSTLELNVVLKRLLDRAVTIIGAEGSSVWLWDDSPPRALVCRAASKQDHNPLLAELRILPGQGIAGWVAENGRTVMITNTAQDTRFFEGVDEKSGANTSSLLATPLQSKGESLGVLEIINKIDGSFNESDRAIAETLADYASIAIYNAQLVETLQTQKKDLQERNAALDAFAHTVAHDLQNPLAALSGFTELLKREDVIHNEPRRSHIIDTLSSNLHKVSNIVRELLLLASVRRTDIPKRPLNMVNIVESAIMRLNHLLEEKSVKLSYPQRWPMAVGYAPWIEEVWENYISNAIKYGGEPPQIELGATENRDSITFWVRDNGIGLTKEAKAIVFAPFTQINQIQATGHGLGLSIVNRIMEKLDGSVGVDSEVGVGSTFYFTLPKPM